MSLSKPTEPASSDDSSTPKSCAASEEQPQILSQRAKWNVGCLFAIRCLVSAAGSFVMISSGELLVRVFRGDTSKSQRILTALNTASIVTTLLTGSLSGGLIDAYGRRACILGSLGCAGALRLWVSRRPTVWKYIVYRVVLAIVMQPLFAALRTALGDLVSRSSDRYARLSTRMETAATAVRVFGLYVVGRLANPGRGMFIAGSFSLAAATVALLGLDETLTAANARPVDWASVTKPWSSVAVLQKSSALKRLTSLYVLMSIPANNGWVCSVYRCHFLNQELLLRMPIHQVFDNVSTREVQIVDYGR